MPPPVIMFDKLTTGELIEYRKKLIEYEATLANPKTLPLKTILPKWHGKDFDLVTRAHFDIGGASRNAMAGAMRDYRKFKGGYIRDIHKLHSKYKTGLINAKVFRARWGKMIDTNVPTMFKLGMNSVGNPLLDTLPPQALRKMKAACNYEKGFMVKFIDDIEAERGRIPYDKRIDFYSGTMDGIYNAGSVEGLPDNTTILWTLNPAAENCDDCIAIAGGNPYGKYTLPAFPADGLTSCMFKCQCILEFEGLPEAARLARADILPPPSHQAVNIISDVDRAMRFKLDDLFDRMNYHRQMIELVPPKGRIFHISQRRLVNQDIIAIQKSQVLNIKPVSSIDQLLKTVTDIDRQNWTMTSAQYLKKSNQVCVVQNSKQWLGVVDKIDRQTGLMSVKCLEGYKQFDSSKVVLFKGRSKWTIPSGNFEINPNLRASVKIDFGDKNFIGKPKYTIDKLKADLAKIPVSHYDDITFNLTSNRTALGNYHQLTGDIDVSVFGTNPAKSYGPMRAREVSKCSTTLYHEIGHNVGYKTGLDTSGKWKEISEFIDKSPYIGDKANLFLGSTYDEAHKIKEYFARSYANYVVKDAAFKTQWKPAWDYMDDLFHNRIGLAKLPKLSAIKAPIALSPQEWIKSLTQHERKVLLYWSGTGYEKIRKIQLTGKYIGDVGKAAKSLETALSRGPITSGKLYRGLHDLSITEYNKILNSNEITFKVASSAAKKEKSALIFARPFQKGNNVLFEISKNKTGVDITSVVGGMETEVILQKGVKYRIIRKSVENFTVRKQNFKALRVVLEEI